MALDGRAENVLKNLVETYIDQGLPVGSRTLSKLPQLGVSSATVRNVMSDLEELGLITAPHTSAGRIPTSQGYRLFVDSMVKASPMNRKLVEKLSDSFEHESDPEALTEDGRVQNRVLHTPENFTESELVEAANYFNQRYKGNTLSDVRRLVVEDMQQDNDGRTSFGG